MERGHGPGRGKKITHDEESFSEYKQAQAEANISKHQAHRWQKLAELPQSIGGGPHGRAF
jgi:hypothetical protein